MRNLPQRSRHLDVDPSPQTQLAIYTERPERRPQLLSICFNSPRLTQKVFLLMPARAVGTKMALSPVAALAVLETVMAFGRRSAKSVTVVAGRRLGSRNAKLKPSSLLYVWAREMPKPSSLLDVWARQKKLSSMLAQCCSSTVTF